MAVRIVTDSTADLNRDFVQEMNVNELPLYLRFKDEVFVENDMDVEKFYQKMASSPTLPATSQPDYLTVHDTFVQLLDEGHDIIGIFISSGLTGPYNSACMVWEELKAKYPQARVKLIDSKMGGMALGYPVREAAKAAAQGKSFDEIVSSTEELLANAHIMFAPATLENLKKGGRIGTAAALLGSILEIKPLLVLRNGTVEVLKKCRGNKAAEDAMVHVLLQDAKKLGIKYVIVHYTYAIERGKRVWQMVHDRLGINAELSDITPVIAAHVGAGAVGIAYFTEKYSM